MGEREPDLSTLLDARTRARNLVAELERQQAEVEANPPDLPPEELASGRMAMTNAIAAARRMLQALDDAIAIATEWN